jgi:dTDP-4-amino-4,6-dideoxygalactose transaminase
VVDTKSAEDGVVEELREETGRKFIHLCGSGTAAILFALRALRVPRKSEVLMPALLCVNPGSATVYAGCRPAFCDVDRDTYNIDLASLEAAIRPETGCIIAVHEHGEPCDIEGVIDIGQRHKVPVIEDSAKTLGVEIGSSWAGGLGDASIFSFGRGKPVEVEGGGGAIATDDPRLSSRLLRLIKEYPYRAVDEELNYKTHRTLFYAVRDAALKDPSRLKKYAGFVEAFRDWYIRSPAGLRLGELESGLKDLRENVERRRRTASIYSRILKGSKAKTPMYSGKGSYVRYPVLIGNPEELGPRLRREGFDSNELIPPVNNMFNPDQPLTFLENSEYLQRRMLILWVYMDEERVKGCAEAVKEGAIAPS